MKIAEKKPKAFSFLLSVFRVTVSFPKPFKNVDLFMGVKFFSICGLLTAFPSFGLGIHLGRAFKEGSKYRNEQINDLNAILQCLLAVGYMGILLLVGNRMLAFFQKLQENTPKNLDEVVINFEKFSSKYYKTAFFMCLVYGLDNTFKESNCALKDVIDGNSTLICGSQIPLLFPMRLSSFVQSFVKVLNWFVLMYYFPSCLTVPALGMGSMELIVARIKHLKIMLKQFNFEGEINAELAKSHMRNCIIYFLEIKSLAAEMNNSVSLLFLPQYTVMSTILALLEYQMIVQFNAATVIRFTGWAFMEFMICMKCQNLLNESLDLAECVYDMKWYNMPQEVRSMYKIFHIAAQTPIHFQARPFVSLDTKFLMNVMKSSYSLMMFFRTWSDEI